MPARSIILIDCYQRETAYLFTSASKHVPMANLTILDRRNHQHQYCTTAITADAATYCGTNVLSELAVIMDAK
jgi:hypothetical protein